MTKDKCPHLYGDNYAAAWPETITLQEPQQPVLMDDKKLFWPCGNPHLLKITSCRTVTITLLVIDPREIQIWKLSAAFSRRNSERKWKVTAGMERDAKHIKHQPTARPQRLGNHSSRTEEYRYLTSLQR